MNTIMRRRLVWTVLLFAAFGAAIGVMFILWAKFQPAYFYSAVGALLIGLLLVWVIGRRPADDGDATESGTVEGSAPGARPQSVNVNVPLPTPRFTELLVNKEGAEPTQIVTERATGMRASQMEEPVEAPEPTVTPAGFKLKGFTLYQRQDGSRTVRFFSKPKPKRGEPIEVPEGFEAVWDKKRKQPVLKALPVPVAPVAAREEASTTASAARPCSAWLSLGELCNNNAQAGSPYCTKHQKYRAQDTFGAVEVKQDQRTLKPAKGLKFKGELEVLADRPTFKKAPKPLKVGTPTFQVRHSRQDIKVPRALKIKQTDFVVRELPSKAAKPLKLKEPNLEVRHQRTAPAKFSQLRVKPTEFVVREQVPKPHRPLKFAQPDLQVKQPGLANVKPLRVKEPQLVVKPNKGNTEAFRKLKIAEPNLVLKSNKPPAPKTKPLSFMPDKLDVVKQHGSMETPTGRAAKCAGRTKNGKPCPNAPLSGSSYCSTHVPTLARSEILVVRDTRKRGPIANASARAVRGAPRRR